MDVSAFLRGGTSPRRRVHYWRGTDLYAVRQGPWKAHYVIQGAYGSGPTRTTPERPRLFHLERDPSERHDVAAAHPEVLKVLRAAADAHLASVERVPSQLERR